MGRAMVDLYCASFRQVPKRIVLDIDDTFDAVHGGQQLRLFNAHYDEYGFQPIVVFDGEGRFVSAVLRPAKRPRGVEIRAHCAAWCGRSAAIGPRSRSSSAPTATTPARRSSIGARLTVSTTSSRLLNSTLRRHITGLEKSTVAAETNPRQNNEYAHSRFNTRCTLFPDNRSG